VECNYFIASFSGGGSEELMAQCVAGVCRDLDPVQAPHWSVRARFEDRRHCLLGLCHMSLYLF